MAPTPARAARGGVGEHHVAPLLVRHLLRHVVPGIGGAHHEPLLVLDYKITVATSLLGYCNMLDPCRLYIECWDRTEIWSE